MKTWQTRANFRVRVHLLLQGVKYFTDPRLTQIEYSHTFYKLAIEHIFWVLWFPVASL